MKLSFERKRARPGPDGAEEDSGAELEEAAREVPLEGRSRTGLLTVSCSRISTLGAPPLLFRLVGSAEENMVAGVIVACGVDPAATNAARLAAAEWRTTERVF